MLSNTTCLSLILVADATAANNADEHQQRRKMIMVHFEQRAGEKISYQNTHSFLFFIQIMIKDPFANIFPLLFTLYTSLPKMVPYINS